MKSNLTTYIYIYICIYIVQEMCFVQWDILGDGLSEGYGKPCFSGKLFASMISILYLWWAFWSVYHIW